MLRVKKNFTPALLISAIFVASNSLASCLPPLKLRAKITIVGCKERILESSVRGTRNASTFRYRGSVIAARIISAELIDYFGKPLSAGQVEEEKRQRSSVNLVPAAGTVISAFVYEDTEKLCAEVAKGGSAVYQIEELDPPCCDVVSVPCDRGPPEMPVKLLRTG